VLDLTDEAHETATRFLYRPGQSDRHERFVPEMPVLVTGAAGFIGHHVCKALLARGEQVIGIDNVNS
jgi:FlaA1/EpsC-like NDP-sugar epimerase